MVGPTRNTKSIRPIARIMFNSDRFFTPLSRPATTEQIARPVMIAMAMICTLMLIGIDGQR